MTTLNSPSFQHSEHVLSYLDTTNEPMHLAPIALLQPRKHRAHREGEARIHA